MANKEAATIDENESLLVPEELKKICTPYQYFGSKQPMLGVAPKRDSLIYSQVIQSV